jgi:hypothetical protein
MSNEFETLLAEGEAFIAKLKTHLSPAVQTEVKAAENDAHAIVSDAASYIKANGLSDLEALAITFVSAMVPGASWTVMLGSLKAQAVTDGVKLVEGAEAVVASKAQADLLAQGKIAAPAPAAA